MRQKQPRLLSQPSTIYKNHDNITQPYQARPSRPLVRSFHEQKDKEIQPRDRNNVSRTKVTKVVVRILELISRPEERVWA